MYYVSQLAVNSVPVRFSVQQKCLMHWRRRRPQRLLMVQWPACYYKQKGVKSFKFWEISLYPENKNVIEWTRTLLSKYCST